MNCTRCGAPNGDDQRFCQRCAAALIDGSPQRPVAPLPAPVQAARSLFKPAPCERALAAGPPSALMPGLVIKPRVVMPALSPEGPLSPLQPAPPNQRARGAPRPAALRLGWGAGGLVLCAALLLGTRQVLPRLPAWPQDWSVPGQDGAATPSFDTPSPVAVPSEPSPPVGPDPAALAGDINAELQRLGVAGIQVTLDGAWAATVRGRLTDDLDRDELLRWVASVPGVERVIDRLQVAPAATAPEQAPVQAPIAVPAAPPVRIEPAQAAVPPPVTQIQAAPAAPPRAPAIQAVEERPPDAGLLARAVQRELDRLALGDVSVEVDPATLQITLRGRAASAGLKAQALAAARAVHPGGRVRDLVFVIEE